MTKVSQDWPNLITPNCELHLSITQLGKGQWSNQASVGYRPTGIVAITLRSQWSLKRLRNTPTFNFAKHLFWTSFYPLVELAYTL